MKPCALPLILDVVSAGGSWFVAVRFEACEETVYGPYKNETDANRVERLEASRISKHFAYADEHFEESDCVEWN